MALTTIDEPTGPDEIAFVWSLQQQATHHERGEHYAVHLQGVHVGRAGEDVTACGIPYGLFWDFGAEQGDLSTWDGCKRCAAVVRRRARQRAGGARR